MNVRVRTSLVSLILLMALAASAAGRASAQTSNNVQIVEAAIVGSELTIRGKNFGGGTLNVVVGDTTATVTSHTDDEIVADTGVLAPGMYSLKVVRDTNAGGTAMSSLLIR